jgi:hypothetical protein
MVRTTTEQVIRAALGTYFPVILYILALITTAYFMSQNKPFWNSYLQAAVFFMGGIQGIWAAIAHLFFPKPTAKQIGWVSNGFQTEMGATNLALGITGLLSGFNPIWLVPVALIIAIIFAGCAYAHIHDRLLNKNTAPCNSGPMLYTTIITSLTLLIAIFMHR